MRFPPPFPFSKMMMMKVSENSMPYTVLWNWRKKSITNVCSTMFVRGWSQRFFENKILDTPFEKYFQKIGRICCLWTGKKCTIGNKNELFFGFGSTVNGNKSEKNKLTQLNWIIWCWCDDSIYYWGMDSFMTQSQRLWNRKKMGLML